ncbi:hypothetical protein BBB57_13740 [Kosakonia sacchari]|nr:hypothetical protein BBB57_13740 [Kosakonia sacchari]
MWDNLLKRLEGVRWEYDGFGRMTERHDSHRGTVQRFSYDDEHRISQVIIEGDAEFTRAEYRYDALGRRTEKQVWRRHTRNAERTQYAWSGLQMVGECSDSNPDAAVQYIYTENSYEPLARVDSRGEHAEVYWYHTELNGLPEKVTDSSGDIIWQGVSTTWGRSERENSTADWDVPQNLRFQGQYLDRETGLHYNTFRYYDPCGGRYTQMDPIGLLGGLNTYTYVVDPLGLTPCITFNKTHKDSLPRPKGIGPNGGRLQSHHGLQQEWANNNLSKYGYDPKLAPTVTIETGKGLPHTIISNAQNARRDLRVTQGNGKWSSSLQSELDNIVTDFRDAGFDDVSIQKVLEQQYKMLDKLNVPYNKVII